MPSPHAYTGNATDAREFRGVVASTSSGCTVVDDRAALREQVREANDIVGVVASRITLRPSGPLHKGLCPFHDDHNPSFIVDSRRQRYKCWSCGEGGDVFAFVQKFDKVTFPEALELLARRAGISLEKIRKSPPGPSRAGMVEVMKWAAEQFQKCLLDEPQAEDARDYLGERKLSLETIRKFGLGYAPNSWDWLVKKAAVGKISAEMLATVGLIKRKDDGNYFDMFRDRAMFPIRNRQGQIVGFGGRILPSSPVSADYPQAKYINSAETPLFSKSKQLYGIDQAVQLAAKVGYLAIVEGYTDVLMAHQHGIGQVVATMGTALNARHITELKNAVSRVVLVFDADAGGNAGVDRALEGFVSNDLDLRIATLPEGLDPCDLLVAQGPEPLRQALDKAIDVFEFKLQRAWAKHSMKDVHGRVQASEEMLKILALAPKDPAVTLETPKMQMMLNRIAHRLLIKEETIWARLKELRKKEEAPRNTEAPEPEPKADPPARHELELLELLLAEPSLVARAVHDIPLEEVEHPGLRKVVAELYRLHAEGLPSDLDHLHERLDNERIWDRVQDLQQIGLEHPDRPHMFQKVVERFRERQKARNTQAIKNELQDADTAKSLELLRKLKNHE